MDSEDVINEEEVVPVLTPIIIGKEGEELEAQIPEKTPAHGDAKPEEEVYPWKVIIPTASVVFITIVLVPSIAAVGFNFNLGLNLLDGIWASFVMILATELGDETFIIAALMSMRHNKLTVLGGALAALYFMTVISSMLGLVLPNLISEATVRKLATGLYIFFGLRLMWIGARGEEEDKEEEFEEVTKVIEGADERAQTSLIRKCGRQICSAVFLEALILTFCAEWGDRSQIATITLAAHQNPLGVIIGACLGHTICTGLAVFAGEWLGKRISQRYVAFVGGALFFVFAFINQVYGLR